MRLNGARGIDVAENDAAEDCSTRVSVSWQKGDANCRVSVVVHEGIVSIGDRRLPIARLQIADCKLQICRFADLVSPDSFQVFVPPACLSICNVQSEICNGSTFGNNLFLQVSNRSVSSLAFHFSFEKGREVMITFIVVYNSIVLFGFFQETQTDFNDLGKLLLVGVAAAIVFAVGFTMVRLRLRDKNPPTSDFISISAPLDKNENVGG